MKMYKIYSLIVEENSIDNLDKQGLYLITNILNGKVYVGQARVNFATRYYAHNYGLTNNVHHNRHLQHAWNKYGKDAFVFSILRYFQQILIFLIRKKIIGLNTIELNLEYIMFIT